MATGAEFSRSSSVEPTSSSKTIKRRIFPSRADRQYIAGYLYEIWEPVVSGMIPKYLVGSGNLLLTLILLKHQSHVMLVSFPAVELPGKLGVVPGLKGAVRTPNGFNRFLSHEKGKLGDSRLLEREISYHIPLRGSWRMPSNEL